MLNKLFLLWLAAFPLMGSPGPATMSLAAMGAIFGTRRSLWYLAGILLGTYAVLLMIAAGITGLILAVPSLVATISIVAAVYIIYLAIRIATAPVGIKASSEVKPASFHSGLILALGNPKAFAAIGAVYSGAHLVDGNLPMDAAIKIAALTLVILIVNPAWLLAGTILSSYLQHPVIGRIANVIFALLLLMSVLLPYWH